MIAGMIFCALGLWGSWGNQCDAGQASWKAGAASAVITPEGPYWMAGYASRREPADGKIHDLMAKVLALESEDGHRLVIVTTDLIGITDHIQNEVQRRAQERFGLKRHELLLNASHTHCGPMVRRYRIQFRNIPPRYAVKVAPYLETLIEKMVGAIGTALDQARPARLTAYESQAGFARNRRFPTEQGFVNRRYDEGPTDHSVPILKVTDAEAGHVVAILFGYACHNTVLGIQQFCGDYAGFAQQAIEAAHPGAVALFMQGAGGDQNPYPRRTLELAKQHGRALAEAVEKGMRGTGLVISGTLESARDDARLEFQPLPSREQLESLLAEGNRYEQTKARYLLEQSAQGTLIETQRCPVQVVRLGEQVLLVAIGGEVVVDYALRIKRQYKAPLVWVAGYSNVVNGYLPSRRVLNEGGYEAGGAMVYMQLPGPYAENVEARVFEMVDRLVKQTARD
jgi:hypothetical protein